MKRMIAGFVVLVAVVSVALALDNITPPSDGSFYDGNVNSGGRNTLSNNLVTAMTAQADTNVTTTATSYTPRRKGDVLVGGAGSGTNAIWIAKGTTTNDWVRVKP